MGHAAAQLINLAWVGMFGAVILLGALESEAADPVDIYSYTNVIKDANIFPPSGDKAVYYRCSDVQFNGRRPSEKIVLFFIRRHPTSGSSIVGGLTIEPDSGVAQGYLNSTNSKNSASNGLLPGEVATNGLNGTSYWIGGHDIRNINGKVGTYSGGLTWSINYEPGEMISNKYLYVEAPDNRIVFEGMPAYPVDGGELGS